MNERNLVYSITAILLFHIAESKLAKKSNRPYSITNVFTPTVSVLAIASYIEDNVGNDIKELPKQREMTEVKTNKPSTYKRLFAI